MSLNHKLSLAFLVTSLSLGAVFLATQSSNAAYHQTAQVQSALGRITAVQGNTFTLDASKDSNSTKERSTAKNSPLTLTLDQDTHVDGKIVIGARANVTYRHEDGNNIAVSVRIVQQS